jgi:hypothetical protein
MAAGIDEARIMKVTRLRTARGGNGTTLENLEGASGRSQRGTGRKDQKSVFLKRNRGGFQKESREGEE